jgi:hypothetical protein
VESAQDLSQIQISITRLHQQMGNLQTLLEFFRLDGETLPTSGQTVSHQLSAPKNGQHRAFLAKTTVNDA